MHLKTLCINTQQYSHLSIDNMKQSLYIAILNTNNNIMLGVHERLK